MNSLSLFEVGEKKIYNTDLVEALRASGIKSGDTVFVHSSLTSFGKLAQLKDRNVFLQAHVDALREAVGPTGTILLPTFTYSFCRNEPFDPKSSTSTVGTLKLFTRTFSKLK